MKIAIIGGNGHYVYALNGMKARADARVVGVAKGAAREDISGLIKSVEAFHAPPAVYEHYTALLERERPDIAVVNPWFSDVAPVTCACLERGISVFAEKPLGITYEQLCAVADAHKKSDARLSCMLGIRYTPWFHTAKRLADSGAIGEIRQVVAQKSYKLGRRGEQYQTRAIYGGTILWVAVHAIDWARWLSGREYKSVYAAHSRDFNGGNGALEANTSCLFTMEGGVIACVNADFLHPAAAARHDDDRVRLIGAEGTIEVIDNRVHLETDVRNEDVALSEPTPLFAEFMDEVAGKGSCGVSANDAIAATLAALKATESAERDALVRF